MSRLSALIITMTLSAPAGASLRTGPPRNGASPTVAELVKGGRIAVVGQLDYDRSDPQLKATITLKRVLRHRDPRHPMKAGEVLRTRLHPTSVYDLIPGASYIWIFKSSPNDRAFISLQHEAEVLKLMDAAHRAKPRTSRR